MANMTMLEAIVDKKLIDSRVKQLQKRATITYIGSDIILNPEGYAGLIELNGQNAGTRGFEIAYGEDFARKNVLKLLESYGKPVRVLTYKGDRKKILEETKTNATITDLEEIRLMCSKTAMEIFTGKPPLTDKEYYSLHNTTSATELNELNKVFNELFSVALDTSPKFVDDGYLYSFDQAKEIVWNNTGSDLHFNRSTTLHLNDELLEKVLSDKSLFPHITSPHGILSVDLHQLTTENVYQLLNTKKSPRNSKIVIKPADGYAGNNIAIISLEKILNNKKGLRHGIDDLFSDPEKHFDDEKLVKNIKALREIKYLVMQPHIKSKEFYNPETGKKPLRMHKAHQCYN